MKPPLLKNIFSLTLLALFVISSVTYAGIVPVQHPLFKAKDQKDDLLIFVGKGADGGRLAIDNHAEFMVARDTNNVVRNWNNAGTFKWSFGRYGYDGSLSDYPLFEADVDGSPAVTFDGNDKLRLITESSTPLPASITDGVLSIELWLKNPEVDPEEVILRFEDGDNNLDITAAQFKLKDSPEWQYLVMISDGKKTSFYKNNKLVNEINNPLAFSNKTSINLGASSFSGSIAAVRFHTEPMEPQDLAHNYTGGILLGTHLFYAINAKKLEDMMTGDPTRESDDLEVRESDHFVSMWIPSGNPKPEDDIAKRVEEKQLPDSEVAYDWLSHTLALHMPLVSDKEELRGDGRKYKIHHGNKWQGGDFMGYDGDIHFGWGCSYAGYFNDHELTHGVDAHQMGAIEGHWWESHANWCPSYAGFPHVNPANLCSQHAHVYPSTGGNYYHAYLIWDHLAEDPEFGPLYPTRLWNYDPTPDKRIFPPQVMKDMDPDPSTPFDDEWVEVAAKNITWDYKRHPEYKRDYRADPRLHWILLEQVPHMKPGWFEPQKWRAPQQHGYNLCPLEVKPGTVSAELSGYIDAERGSDWRGMFVAVQNDGSPRYGKIFTTEKPGSFEVQKDDTDLFLVVVATPTNIIKMGIFGNDEDADYRKPGKDRFPYLVKLTGTNPRAELWKPEPGIHGTVAPTAYVDPTAHIGPKAQVLDNARVEDYSTVNGTVRGNARITGHAVVSEKAVVEDNARVSDFARVNSHIYGNARVMEHATVNGETYDFAVIKGNAISSGPVHGNGIVDGNYIKSNDVDKGYWFNWSWGSGQAPGEVDEDFKSLYCQYEFDKHNGYRVWDTHGITWARTVNGPKYTEEDNRSILVFDGEDDFVDLHNSIANAETVSIELSVKWAGGDAGQKLLSFSNTKTGDAAWLTPKDANGTLSFNIKVGDTVNSVAAKSALPPGKWFKIQVITFDDKILLYVNDKKAAADKNFTLDLEDVKANASYIGRGPDGNYFNGAIDSLTVWSKALIEDVPPTPNPSDFIIKPMALDAQSCMMQAVMASDANGPVEYYFEETTEKNGGKSSDWQLSPVFMATGLKENATYAYRVRARDKSDNVTEFSKIAKYKNVGAPEHFVPDENGVISIEAENFDTATKGTLYNNEWEITDKPEGFSGKGVVTVPDRGKQIGDKFATDKSPRLDYTVKFEMPGKYFMYLRGTGNPSGDSCHGGLNMQETDGLKAIGNNQLNGYEFKWSNGNEFTVPQAGVYKLNLWMREDGAVIDKIVIMKKRNELEGKGPAESKKN